MSQLGEAEATLYATVDPSVAPLGVTLSPHAGRGVYVAAPRHRSSEHRSTAAIAKQAGTAQRLVA